MSWARELREPQRWRRLGTATCASTDNGSSPPLRPAREGHPPPSRPFCLLERDATGIPSCFSPKLFSFSPSWEQKPPVVAAALQKAESGFSKGEGADDPSREKPAAAQ